MSDTKARNIIQRLADIGAIVPGSQTEKLVSEVHAMTHDNHIPGGGYTYSATNLRPSPAGSRCGVRTGNDPQSGPFYCGGVATLMGDSLDGKFVYVCAGHEGVLRRIAEPN